MKDSSNGDEAGDFVREFCNGAIDFGWDKFDDEDKLFKRAIEMKNGCSAIIVILGLMVHEQLGVSVLIFGEL